MPVQRFWATLRQGLDQALEAANAAPGDIAAVSYSSQANTFLLLDSADEPLTPLIFWTDLRADPVEGELASLWEGGEFLQATGIGITGEGLCLSKAAWLRKHRPEIWKQAVRMQTISDYFVYAMTGRPVGDEGTASLTGLWNLPARDFWQPSLDAAGLSAGLLSRPLPPGTTRRTCRSP